MFVKGEPHERETTAKRERGMRESFKTVFWDQRLQRAPKSETEITETTQSRERIQKGDLCLKKQHVRPSREKTRRNQRHPPCSSSFSKGHVQQLQSHTKKKKVKKMIMDLEGLCVREKKEKSEGEERGKEKGEKGFGCVLSCFSTTTSHPKSHDQWWSGKDL